jgi:hypothetical protein
VSVNLSNLFDGGDARRVGESGRYRYSLTALGRSRL